LPLAARAPARPRQQELSSGLNSQARALARIMLAQRQSELAQLQQWQHDRQQMGMMG